MAVALYSATFVLIALAYNALWWYAVRVGNRFLIAFFVLPVRKPTHRRPPM